MVPKSESLCKKKMNCLGYVLTFRSLLRVFDFGILALSLSTWTQMNQIHDEYKKISIFSDNRSRTFIMGFLLFVHIRTSRGELAVNSVRKLLLFTSNAIKYQMLIFLLGCILLFLFLLCFHIFFLDPPSNILLTSKVPAAGAPPVAAAVPSFLSMCL